jgi:hypothetical protein
MCPVGGCYKLCTELSGSVKFSAVSYPAEHVSAFLRGAQPTLEVTGE